MPEPPPPQPAASPQPAMLAKAGTHDFFRLLIVCCGLIGLAPMARAQSMPQWGLPQLMANLAQVKSAGAQFTERKTMAMLNTPLMASGILKYRAPDWMQKTTLSPTPETFVLDGGQVTMSGNGSSHVFAVADDPLIETLTGGILATLAGNLPTLGRLYTIQFTGAPAAWQLLLRPRDQAAARLISWISISGHQNLITSIDTASGNGDHSEMSVVETVHAG